LENPVNDLELLDWALPVPDQEAVDTALARSIGSYRSVQDRARRRAPPQRRTVVATRRPVRRVVVGLCGLVAALAAAVILVVVEPWQPTGETAVARAATMVSPHARTVLHVRMDGHHIYSPFIEQWIAPDGSWREEHGGTDLSGPCTVENGYDASTQIASTYDVRTRTIYRRTLSPAQIRFAAQSDPMAQVRQWLSGGQLRAAGQTVLDGRRVTRLVPTHGRRSLYGAIAYYIDARTAQPVRWQLNATQWYDFTAYAQLPATPHNLRLTSLRDQHPQAILRHGWGARGGCGSG
jgi:hypothetical protein